MTKQTTPDPAPTVDGPSHSDTPTGIRQASDPDLVPSVFAASSELRDTSMLEEVEAQVNSLVKSAADAEPFVPPGADPKPDPLSPTTRSTQMDVTGSPTFEPNATELQRRLDDAVREFAAGNISASMLGRIEAELSHKTEGTTPSPSPSHQDLPTQNLNRRTDSANELAGAEGLTVAPPQARETQVSDANPTVDPVQSAIPSPSDHSDVRRTDRHRANEVPSTADPTQVSPEDVIRSQGGGALATGPSPVSGLPQPGRTKSHLVWVLIAVAAVGAITLGVFAANREDDTDSQNVDSDVGRSITTELQLRPAAGALSLDEAARRYLQIVNPVNCAVNAFLAFEAENNFDDGSMPASLLDEALAHWGDQAVARQVAYRELLDEPWPTEVAEEIDLLARAWAQQAQEEQSLSESGSLGAYNSTLQFLLANGGFAADAEPANPGLIRATLGLEPSSVTDNCGP